MIHCLGWSRFSKDNYAGKYMIDVPFHWKKRVRKRVIRSSINETKMSLVLWNQLIPKTTTAITSSSRSRSNHSNAAISMTDIIATLHRRNLDSHPSIKPLTRTLIPHNSKTFCITISCNRSNTTIVTVSSGTIAIMISSISNEAIRYLATIGTTSRRYVSSR